MSGKSSFRFSIPHFIFLVFILATIGINISWWNNGFQEYMLNSYRFPNDLHRRWHEGMWYSLSFHTSVVTAFWLTARTIKKSPHDQSYGEWFDGQQPPHISLQIFFWGVIIGAPILATLIRLVILDSFAYSLSVSFVLLAVVSTAVTIFQMLMFEIGECKTVLKILPAE